jgi:hypothetical protein
MDSRTFVARAEAIGPRVGSVVRKHLEESEGEPLLHVLMASLRRWAISSFYNLEDETDLIPLMDLLEEALRTGEEALENAVAVSFVEDACTWDPRMTSFLATWPIGLKDEAERQRRLR